MWADVPKLKVVPVQEGLAVHYEVRTGSGATMGRHKDEHSAIDWCKENAFEYTVSHSKATK